MYIYYHEIFTCVSVSFKVLLSWSRFATLKYLFLSNSASKDLICAAVNAVRGLFFLSSSLIAVVVLSWTSLSTLVVEFAPLLLVHASATMLRIGILHVEAPHKINSFAMMCPLTFKNTLRPINSGMYQTYDDAAKDAMKS